MIGRQPELGRALADGRRDVYLAFIDILGFSALVKKDWEQAARIYADVMVEAQRLHQVHKDHKEWWSQGRGADAVPTMQTLSDSIVIVGADLAQVGSLAQSIQTAALTVGGVLVRGGIAYGPHAEVSDGNNAFVVSQPLAAAAALEATYAIYPRIVLDPASGVSKTAEEWRNRLGHGLFVECDDGLWMVNPFSFTLGSGSGPNRFEKAREVLEPLAEEYKSIPHSMKYQWMLSAVDWVAEYLDDLADHPDNPANYDHEPEE